MREGWGLTEPSFDVDRLSYEIFSILESNFLFGCEDQKLIRRPATGRVRILSIDAGGATDGLLAASALTHLESALQNLSGDPTARIADFFDVAAGAGAGGLLAALLFAIGPAGRPLFSAAEAFRFMVANRRRISRRRTIMSRIFRKKKDCESLDRKVLRGVFGELTLRDALKPLLITCFDVATAAPFLFSRAAAVESDGYNFLLRDVCAATVGGAAEMRSVDGRTVVAALDGGVATGNPTVAAITHVLNNPTEFPFSTKVEDLFVVSLGNGESTSPPSPTQIARIAGQLAADMVDQAVSMAFGKTRTENYIRIQASLAAPAGALESDGGEEKSKAAAEALLGQKSVEAVLFKGRLVSVKTNAEKLEEAAAELVKESEGRKACPFPVVLFKQCSPRSSSVSLLSSSPASTKLKPDRRIGLLGSPPEAGTL